MNKKLNDGVGKKIVEALKKQSEGELPEIEEPTSAVDGLIPNIEETVAKNKELASDDESDFDELLKETDSEEAASEISENSEEGTEDAEVTQQAEEPTTEATKEDVINISNTANNTFSDINFDNFETEAPAPQISDAELNELEIPSNILILKKLISQLPSGVTRHTGAQIIKQTMEALGISMKNVLKEAQDVQDNLKDSAKECQATIQEYRKQIGTLEKKSQKYQRQYGALNDLISLFIQTTK